MYTLASLWRQLWVDAFCPGGIPAQAIAFHRLSSQVSAASLLLLLPYIRSSRLFSLFFFVLLLPQECDPPPDAKPQNIWGHIEMPTSVGKETKGRAFHCSDQLPNKQGKPVKFHITTFAASSLLSLTRNSFLLLSSWRSSLIIWSTMRACLVNLAINC